MVDGFLELALVRRGVAFDEAEADRVVRSIGNRGWQGYMANMSAHVTAMVVEMRANMDRPKKQVAE